MPWPYKEEKSKSPKFTANDVIPMKLRFGSLMILLWSWLGEIYKVQMVLRIVCQRLEVHLLWKIKLCAQTLSFLSECPPARSSTRRAHGSKIISSCKKALKEWVFWWVELSFIERISLFYSIDKIWQNIQMSHFNLKTCGCLLTCSVYLHNIKQHVLETTCSKLTWMLIT